MALFPPLHYDGALPPPAAAPQQPPQPVQHSDLIEYFSEQDSSVLGRLNTCYLRWAELKGPGCEQCRALSLLFAKGVDSVKTGERASVPASLVIRAEDVAAARSTAGGAEPVWSVLLERAAAVHEAYARRQLASLWPGAAGGAMAGGPVYACTKNTNATARREAASTHSARVVG
jgi:hypothetical protein